jgi:hypothetical protein
MVSPVKCQWTFRMLVSLESVSCPIKKQVRQFTCNEAVW